MNDSYFIDNKEYTKAGLLAYAENKLEMSGLPDWEHDLFSFIVQWFSSADYVLIYTSGSTGPPKEIRIPKTQMLRSAKRTLRYFDVKPFENILLCLPVKYIAGMMVVVRAFAGSGNLVTLSPQQLSLGSIKGKIGFASMVPLQVAKLLDEHRNLDNLEKLLLGGAPVSQNLAEKVKKSFRGQVWETYGMTETITHVAVRKIDEEPQVFHALPGVSFSVDDRECLIISDPFIRDQQVVTNDRVELLSNTSFRLLGRMDHVINSGGIKVQPEEIERLIGPNIDGRFCITSIPHETMGQMVVLVVEKGADLDKLRDGLAAIENYRRPKKIIELDLIPTSSNGKIDLKAVKDKVSKIVSIDS
jgi:O-succinylbenzoic acid--CoA ligase